jgi:hypothetical protein
VALLPALAAIALLAGCQWLTAVWVEEGSTATHLVLRFGYPRRGHDTVTVDFVRVNACGAPLYGPGAMWELQRGLARRLIRLVFAGPPMTRLVYGETPSGFESLQGPKPLTPGCYQVHIGGTGETEFTIDSSGTVTEREWNSETVRAREDADKIGRSVTCIRGPADSARAATAAVDTVARVYRFRSVIIRALISLGHWPNTRRRVAATSAGGDGLGLVIGQVRCLSTEFR